MKILMVFVIILATGEGNTGAVPAASVEDCKDKRVKFAHFVGEHNRKEENKVKFFATSCVELVEAPRGSDT
jgi:hypothetical protein